MPDPTRPDLRRRRLCAALGSLPLAALPRAASALPRGIAAALAQVGIPASACGLVVQALDARRPALSHNADLTMPPASVLKLVPTYAALNLLGPAWHWSTPVYAVGALDNGVLSGDLGFVGSGDPHLMADDLWHLVWRLRGLGLRRIDGNLLVDRSAFDLPPHDRDAFDGDGDAPYNAGPDAFLLNLRTVSLAFHPGDGRVDLGTDPPLAGFAPRQLPRLGHGDCGDWRSTVQADLAQPLAPSFAGSYPAACGDRVWNIDPRLPADDFVGAVFGALFAQAGIAWSGRVVSGRLPAGAQLLTSWDSPPLAEIVRDINKFSNNVMAQQLFLTLALHAGRSPADFGAAGEVTRAWLDSVGLGSPGLVLDNGCGLSRAARISPAGLNRLLRAAWSSPVMPEFLASLPLAGLDGTLSHRLLSSTGLVRAKTGTLRDVLSLAGYVDRPDGRRASFVAMVDHPRALDAWPLMQAVVDAAVLA